jgi:hypothetical protein
LSDHPPPGNEPESPRPDPAAPPPSTPDGTSNPAQPVSAEPWSTPSGDFPPPAYSPGAAPIPPPVTSQFPQVNYAPPGRPPDYGYQYQPPPPYGPGDYPAAPPGYPGYAPPPAPRKSNAPLIAVIVAVALLLCGGVATTGILVAHNVSARAHEAVKPLTDPTADPGDPDVPGLPGLPTAIPTDGGGGLGAQIKVTYQVTGDGPAEILYLEKLGAAPTQLENAKLPWTFTTTMQTPALISIIAMRVGSTDGQVTCRALVDGQEVKKATSASSAFSPAACTYFAVD